MPAKCQHWRIGNRLALTLILVGGRIEVTRRTLARSFPQVTMTAPDGSTRIIDLKRAASGNNNGSASSIVGQIWLSFGQKAL